MRNKKSRITENKQVLHANDFAASPTVAGKPVTGVELATLAKRMIATYQFGIQNILPNPDIKTIPPAKLRTLLRDPHLSACVSSRKAGILKLKLRVWPGRDRTDDSHLRIEEMLNALDLRQIMDDATDAPLYGRQTFEVLWDDRYRPRAVIGKPFEFFAWNEDGVLCRREDPTNPSSRLIPLEDRNFITVWHRRKWGINDGMALLESCFWPLFFKKTGAKFWAQFMEKYAIPWVIAKYRPGTSDETIDAIQEAVDNMIQAATAVIPDDGSMEIVEAQGKTSSADIFERNLAFQNAEISKAILGSTLTVEQGDRGAYSLGQVHFEVRQDLIDSDREIVLRVFDTLIAWLDEIHFGHMENHPTADLYDPAKEDEETAQLHERIAKRDETLARLGVRFRKEYFIKTYGLSDEDFDLGDTVSPVTRPQSEFASPDEYPADEVIHALSPADYERMVTPAVKAVLDAVRKSASYEEAQEAVLAAYPNMDMDTLIETMSRALFIARILGGSRG